MRPRPDAAENRDFVDQVHDLDHASMRPRPDAAENRRGLHISIQGGATASMRPRPDAAENLPRRRTARRGCRRFNEAAARCRGKPRAAPGGPRRLRRFNEAAARCRGKPHGAVDDDAETLAASMRPRPDAAENRPNPVVWSPPADAASMRPRPDAAENPLPLPRRLSHRARFNEAAARCRGKPLAPAAAPAGAKRFNEAAARCRGKPSPCASARHRS